MPPFKVPNLDQVHRGMIADFQGRFPNDDISEDSDNWKRAAIAAGGIAGLHAHTDYVFDELFPDTCSDERLPRHGNIKGVTRRGATPAKKSDALRVFGDNSGGSVAIGNELIHADGTKYQVNENAAVAANTFVDVDIIAKDTGAKTRKNSGEILTFTAPPSGIAATATLVKNLDEDGEDLEAPASYRARILARNRQPGMGGNVNDFITWCLEVLGIATAYIYPLRNGLLTIDVAALHSGRGSSRVLTAPEIATLLAYLDTKRHPGCELRVLTVSTEDEDVELRVTEAFDTAFKFDWVDVTPLVISTWDSVTRKLKFTASRPADMEVGDHIVLKGTGGSRNDGHQYRIEAFGVAADEVILEADDEFAVHPPTGGWNVYSGGVLTEPIREAVLTHIDSLGPGRGTFAAGSFVSALRPGDLEKVTRLVSGVYNVIVVAPSSEHDSANTTPSNSIGLKIARQVIVRKA